MAYEMRISDWSSDLFSSDLDIIPGISSLYEGKQGFIGTFNGIVQLIGLIIDLGQVKPLRFAALHGGSGFRIIRDHSLYTQSWRNGFAQVPLQAQSRIQVGTKLIPVTHPVHDLKRRPVHITRIHNLAGLHSKPIDGGRSGRNGDNSLCPIQEITHHPSGVATSI